MLGDDTTTEKRLRLLQAEFTQHEKTGPGDGRSATLVHGAPPVDLGTLDYMRSAVAEVVTHTQAVAPNAGPAPADQADVYRWSRESTEHLDIGPQLVREAIIYRQGLEHALAMGDTDAVRTHPCPGCGCWGLYWRAAAKRAVCVNRRCTDKDGVASTWTLARIAQQYIAAQESASRRAT
ncbi:hypothetical protein ACIOEZ_34075 [Streptomyces sp. NPDC087866]|uniref:hypothetical protein n=1 Tax=Streptomyces sp. NPDC087866 TaxID=3365815 RepID=UPI0038174A04